MNERQTDSLLCAIAGAYPKFELTKDRIKIWTEFMTEIEYAQAYQNLKNHIRKSKYPPSISEILNIAAEDNESGRNAPVM